MFRQEGDKRESSPGVPGESTKPEELKPGKTATWQNKKGDTLTGELVKRQSKGGKHWFVKNAKGKQTLVHEKHLSVAGTNEVAQVPEIKGNSKKSAKPFKGPGQIGAKYAQGDIPATATRRQTTPFPRVDTGTDQKAQNTVKRVEKWLIENASAEAHARGMSLTPDSLTAWT